jgi:hypothetical protein
LNQFLVAHARDDLFQFSTVLNRAAFPHPREVRGERPGRNRIAFISEGDRYPPEYPAGRKCLFLVGAGGFEPPTP